MDNSTSKHRISLAILAAGIGSRYGGLKQIAPLGPSGEILLDYAIYDGIQAGIDRVVFLIRPDMEDIFRDKIGHRFEKIIDVEYAYQKIVDQAFPETEKWADRKKPWGTAHAILSCAQAIKEPFLVINADDFYGRSAYQASVDFLGSTTQPSDAYAMVAYRLSNTLSKYGTVARGICQKREDNLLTSIIEETSIQATEKGIQCGKDATHRRILNSQTPVSMNFWAFTPSIFPHLASGFRDFLRGNSDFLSQEFMIPSVIQNLIDHQPVTVRLLDSTDTWFGVTYPQDVTHVRDDLARLAQESVYPNPLFQ